MTSDARLLIVNADDFGMSPEINEGIILGFRRGVITETSLMPKGPFAKEAAREALEQGIEAGIHIDLDRLLGWYSPGGERFSRQELTAMMKEEGFLRILSREIEEQIELFLSFGLSPSHINTHHHVHGFLPIFRLMIEAAQRFGIRAMRFSRTGYRLPTRQDIPFFPSIYREMEAELRRRGMIFAEQVIEGMETFMGQEIKGITELVLHPAKGGEEWRRKELEGVLSPSFREKLQKEGVKLTSFGRLAASQLTTRGREEYSL